MRNTLLHPESGRALRTCQRKTRRKTGLQHCTLGNGRQTGCVLAGSPSRYSAFIQRHQDLPACQSSGHRWGWAHHCAEHASSVVRAQHAVQTCTRGYLTCSCPPFVYTSASFFSIGRSILHTETTATAPTSPPPSLSTSACFLRPKYSLPIFFCCCATRASRLPPPAPVAACLGLPRRGLRRDLLARGFNPPSGE